jgi:hypothetical protein
LHTRTHHSDGTADAASVYTSKSNVPAHARRRQREAYRMH